MLEEAGIQLSLFSTAEVSMCADIDLWLIILKQLA